MIGGRHARAAKMRAAQIRPLAPCGSGDHAADGQELRVQTAGIGVDVLNMPDGLLIRIPASFTFQPNSAALRPEFDATLLELSRNLRLYGSRPMSTCWRDTDTSGSAAL